MNLFVSEFVDQTDIDEKQNKQVGTVFFLFCNAL